MEAGLSGKFWRDGRTRTAKLQGLRETSGIHEEVFRESTAGRRVEAGLSGKFRQDSRMRTAKLQGLRETSGIHEEVFRESTAGRRVEAGLSGTLRGSIQIKRIICIGNAGIVLVTIQRLCYNIK